MKVINYQCELRGIPSLFLPWALCPQRGREPLQFPHDSNFSVTLHETDHVSGYFHKLLIDLVTLERNRNYIRQIHLDLLKTAGGGLSNWISRSHMFVAQYA